LQTEQVIIGTNFDKNTLWQVLSIGSKLCKYNDVLNKKGYFSKYFYALSGRFSLHPDYIKELMDNAKIAYKDKYDVIFKLISHSKENIEFNYNKSLVKQLL
jgi:hypothetical protein